MARRPRAGLSRLLALVWLGLAIGPIDAATDLSSQRQAFAAADQALQNGQTAAIDALADYPLYPYLLYRDISRRLERNPVGEVRTFLQRYAPSPLADRLRGQWLRQLAGERRWSDFLQDYQPTGELALECWRRQALLNTGRTDAALQAIDELWLRGAALPSACEPVVDYWVGRGGLNSGLIWRRFKLALAQGERRLAQQLQNLLPAGEQAAAKLWLTVDDNPRLLLDSARLAGAGSQREELLLHGLSRWSRQDSVSAAAAFDTLQSRYNLRGDPWRALERQLAVFMAARGHADAMRRLTALPAASIDATVREWRVRAALRQRDWEQVLQWLEQLQPEQRAEPRWRYWRARSLEALGRRAEAVELYRQLAAERDYHGFLAADRLGAPYRFNDKPLPVSAKELDAMERAPGLARARELYLLGRLAEATTEWNYTIDGLSQPGLRRVAKLAQRWGWHYQAIATLARAGYWDDLELRFPRPYQEQVALESERNQLDPAWLYGVMRQESSFRHDAASPAGALGLMQLMPATARTVALELQRNPPSASELLQADLNIAYAAYYLRQTLARFQGQLLLATAAYNAGPNKVMEWLPDAGPLEADIWAETIPYQETRTYVQRVMEYTTFYGQQLGPGHKISIRLGQIPARSQPPALLSWRPASPPWLSP